MRSILHTDSQILRGTTAGVTLVLLTAACGTSNNKRADSTALTARDTAMTGVRPDSLAGRSNSTVVASSQQAVLDALGTLGGKPIESLSATEARKQPSPTDAVHSILTKEGKAVAPEAVGKVVNRTIPGPGGALPVRIYTPAGTGPFPVIVYFHGGGFVIATNDTYDASARALANAAGAVLISVEYRKAPEHKFPAAHDDAYAAYLWACMHAASINGDSTRIALAGESAGGNLAIATAIMARDKKAPAPVHILAVYPIVGTDTTTASYVRNATAKPLSRAMMAWFLKQYVSTAADASDTRLNVVAADLKGLPPVTIVSAEIDPLMSEGEQITSLLKAAGVKVEQKTFTGMAHEFFGQGAVVPMALDAVAFAANGLKSGFTR